MFIVNTFFANILLTNSIYCGIFKSKVFSTKKKSNFSFEITLNSVNYDKIYVYSADILVYAGSEVIHGDNGIRIHFTCECSNSKNKTCIKLQRLRQ